jgi:hypothetical protein
VSNQKPGFSGGFYRIGSYGIFRCTPNLKAGLIAPALFLVLHSGFFYMVYKDLCRMECLAFRGCSRMGLASVSLFCTVNRSSFWQKVCDFSVGSKTVGMMPVLRFIPNLYKMS